MVVTAREMSDKPLKPGDRVRVQTRKSYGHCRAPFYLRGKAGVVAEVLGIFHDPERLAYHKPGLPKLALYKIRFRQKDVWDSYTGPASDQVDADLTQNWLEPLK